MMKRFVYALLISYTILFFIEVAFFFRGQIDIAQFVIFLISYVLFIVSIIYNMGTGKKP